MARTEQAGGYKDEFFECLDVLIDGQWIDTYGSHEQGNDVSLPDQDYIACRYILATI